jgi:hypothetical protein
MGRLVDVFAGKDSLADKLRKRRDSIESGDPSGGGQQIEDTGVGSEPKVEEIPKKDRPKGSGIFTMDEIKKGFRSL